MIVDGMNAWTTSVYAKRASLKEAKESTSTQTTSEGKKLLSGRPKDAEDIAALCHRLGIRTRTQALVDRYADRSWQQECQLDATLDALF